MTNTVIKNEKIDIETIITNIYGSVDNSATYILQNIGGNSIMFETVIDALDETKNQGNVLDIYNIAYYKHGSSSVKIYSIYGSIISINKLG